MKTLLFFIILFSPTINYPQSDLDKTIKAGELLLGGFSIFKVARSDTKKDSKTISSVCIKNKLSEKIVFKLEGKDEQENDVKKELVVQSDGKECVFNLPKGVYTYEVTLASKEIYKKGEYKFDDEVIITIKKED
ncbi:MAG: hypothetical protein CFE23_06770 [Flavobacterium sp. BFFFF1]|uniref:hypothetical protein n=1 Tax=unclassified Flavobacterium TaxID=196869 RepID=UPI000BDC3896|nr:MULTISPECIES: hypothetical protein [unclassified Flavobacterium]OYU80930.1 MAG: hypothetical protein CFE23_06770 [Flavobacterium sp. BFFFF1]